jgi:TRAP-type C4-dicarboxylate transport system substrate-binding protein
MKILPAALAAAAITAGAPAWAQVTTLNVSSWLPPQHPVYADMLVPWCADIQKDTEGKVKCNLLPKPVVIAMQTMDAVRDNLADVSFTVHGYTAGRYPLAKAAEFPFLGDSAEATSVAWNRIYNKMLAPHEEYKGIVQLALFTHGPGQLYNAARPVKTAKDMEGLKMRIGGGVVIDTAKALGMIPLVRPSTETYEMISGGIADGAFLPKETVRSLKLESVIKYATSVPGGLYNSSFTLVMNQAKFNKLGKAEQAVILKHSGEAFSRRAGKAWDAADVKGVEVMKSAGIQVVSASDELVKAIRARTDPIEKEWIEKDAKPRGVDGAAVLAALRAEIRNVAAGK